MQAKCDAWPAHAGHMPPWIGTQGTLLWQPCSCGRPTSCSFSRLRTSATLSGALCVHGEGKYVRNLMPVRPTLGSRYTGCNCLSNCCHRAVATLKYPGCKVPGTGCSMRPSCPPYLVLKAPLMYLWRKSSRSAILCRTSVPRLPVRLCCAWAALPALQTSPASTCRTPCKALVICVGDVDVIDVKAMPNCLCAPAVACIGADLSTTAP
jgi:hypothetical protein